MKKTVISRKIYIDATKQKVWDVLSDFGNVQALSPNVAKSYLTSEQKNGVGAKRHCDFTAMGSQVEEKIVEWNEGESLKIDVYESKNMPMVTGMEAEFNITEEDGKACLTGTFKYGMTNALGGFLNNVAMKKMNIKAWEGFIAGIKHHIETGENVQKDTKLDTSSVMT